VDGETRLVTAPLVTKSDIDLRVWTTGLPFCSMKFNLQRYWKMPSIVLMALALCCAVLVLCLVSSGLVSVSLSSTIIKNPAVSDKQCPGHFLDNRRNETLGVASAIYVISLSRRHDRRETFDLLGTTLGFRWTYSDAVDSNHPVVGRILDAVRIQREAKQADSMPMQPYWPEDINAQSASGQPIDIGGSDLWTLDETDSQISSSSQHHSPSNHSFETPLTCGLEDDTVPLYTLGLSDHQILNAPKIACWHSHLDVIRLAASAPAHTVTLVLEDDIDMEWDTRERLEDMWDGLPAGWDIVFLGEYVPPISFFIITNEIPL
jgi:hypothetical protein